MSTSDPQHPNPCNGECTDCPCKNRGTSPTFRGTNREPSDPDEIYPTDFLDGPHSLHMRGEEPANEPTQA